MNFFGHAVVAVWEADDPGFVLGAMLPDLASMAGVRLGSIRDDRIARGVDLHHATDERFHSATVFKRLCADAQDTLCAQGVGRATARAVGHVGTELLLDGVLSEDTLSREAYAHAVAHRAERGLDGALVLHDGSSPASLASMLGRLARAPLPEGYREPDFVLDRLHTILARRPRLAMRPEDVEPVRAWLRSAHRVLRDEGQGHALVESLR